jgi:hypothetical protein
MFPELTRDDVFRIETAHLWLRWPRAVDARDFARLASDQEAMKQTSCLLAPFDAFTADDFVIGARRANAQSEGMVLALAPRQDPSAFLGMAGVQAKGANTARKMVVQKMMAPGALYKASEKSK